VEGFGAAVAAAFEYGLEIVDCAGTTPPPVPPVLRAQARLAARNKVDLETVLRRYAAGHALLVDFLIEEAERGGDLGPAEVRRLLRQSARGVDLILSAVADDYARERYSEHCGHGGRRLKAVERLLSGEPPEAGDLNYELKGSHTAIVLRGESEEQLRGLAQALDRQLLVVSPRPRLFWGWLGGRKDLDPEILIERARRALGPAQALAAGEPASGLAGWRLSHRQARIASEFVRSEPQAVSRYADVAVLSSIAKDPVLSESLRHLFLTPLDQGMGRGNALRHTLKEYFAAGGNISSAAAALNVNRETVRNRLRAVEERLGCSIARRSLELQAALKLEEAG
jgi:PucR C-terminal helix-turn-helix domain/GGDEF-like domain